MRFFALCFSFFFFVFSFQGVAMKRKAEVIIIDERPLRIKSCIPVEKNKLEILFNKKIDSQICSQNQQFFVNAIGYPKSVELLKEDRLLRLSFEQNFEYGLTYTLQIKEVFDTLGFVLKNTLLRFSLPQIAEPSDIIINEILFNPPSGGVDYLEIYNRSDKIFDLSTLLVGTRNTALHLRMVYRITAGSRLLAPKEFAVLTIAPNILKETYWVVNPDAIIKMKKLPSFPSKSGVAVLLNQENTVIDELHYNEKMHAKILTTKKGVSLERISYNESTQNLNNWKSAAGIAGYGTPTYKNSVHKETTESKEAVFISPKVFSPDGDGVDDTMEIHYEFESAGNLARVTIFDSMGRLFCLLVNNLSLQQKGQISWDGSAPSGQKAPSGRYVLLIELFGENGSTKVYKKSCVLHSFYH